MTTPTREEIDAKLEAIEAGIDARARSMEGKLDTNLAEMRGHQRIMTLLAERAVAASEAAAAAAERASAAAERASTAAERASGVKQTLVITSLATLLSVVAIAVAGYFGIRHSNDALLQSALQSFEAGRSSVAQPPAVTPGAVPRRSQD
jgi:hypothetical protein